MDQYGPGTVFHHIRQQRDRRHEDDDIDDRRCIDGQSL